MEANNRGIADMKIDMFKRWLKSNTKAAWKDVVSALRQMNENRIAKCIEEQYCEQCQNEQDTEGN